MRGLIQNKNKKDNNFFNSWSYSKENYILFIIGIVLIILGYITMSQGEVNSFQSLTLAPLMLFFGYIIFIPLSLIYRSNIKKNKGS